MIVLVPIIITLFCAIACMYCVKQENKYNDGLFGVSAIFGAGATLFGLAVSTFYIITHWF